LALLTAAAVDLLPAKSYENVILYYATLGMSFYAFIMAMATFLLYQMKRKMFPLHALLFVLISCLTLIIYVLVDVSYFSALSWLFAFTFDNMERLCICIFWIFCVVLSIRAFRYMHEHKSNAQPESITNIKRKYFHFLAFIMFTVGYMRQSLFQHVAFSVAFGVFILLEVARSLKVFPSATVKINNVLLFQVVDNRDSGYLIVSHIYLLLGCAIPIWLNDEKLKPNLAGLSGILALGIGDAFASIVGQFCGGIRWPGRKKTVEGSLAFAISILTTVHALDWIFPSAFLIESVNWQRYSINVVLIAMLEAYSLQNDNLIIPPLFYILSQSAIKAK